MSPRALANDERQREERRDYLRSFKAGVVSPRPIGYVYFVEAEGLDRIKIGWTAGPVVRRVKHLQCACPVPLRVLGFFSARMAHETSLHRRFGSLRCRPDGEWFHASPALRAYIEGMKGIR